MAPLSSTSSCVGGGLYQKATDKGRHVGGHFQFSQSGDGQDGQVSPLGNDNGPGRGVRTVHGLRPDSRVVSITQGLLFLLFRSCPRLWWPSRQARPADSITAINSETLILIPQLLVVI